MNLLTLGVADSRHRKTICAGPAMAGWRCRRYRERSSAAKNGSDHVPNWIEFDNSYLGAGLAGLGILWPPGHMSAPHIARGELVPLFAGWHLDPMPLYVAFRPNRHVSAQLRVFID